MEEKNAEKEKETKTTPAKGKRFGVGCLWALVILLAIVAIFSVLINAALIAERAPSAMKEVFTPYREKIYSGEGDDKIALIEAKGILVFSSGTYHPENHLNVRFFAHYYGVPEDPATGSANGCLAGYLVKHRYFGRNSTMAGGSPWGLAFLPSCWGIR